MFDVDIFTFLLARRVKHLITEGVMSQTQCSMRLCVGFGQVSCPLVCTLISPYAIYKHTLGHGITPVVREET